jgi:hypothetical protein
MRKCLGTFLQLSNKLDAAFVWGLRNQTVENIAKFYLKTHRYLKLDKWSARIMCEIIQTIKLTLTYFLSSVGGSACL